MYKGFTRLSIDELFERDVNIKGTYIDLKRNRVLGMLGDTFFSQRWDPREATQGELQGELYSFIKQK